jgi:peptidyl-tRNA hydrolase, PTH1 family
MVLEKLVQGCSGQSFLSAAREPAKTQAKVYRVCDTFFAEPQTYMNESGRAVAGVIEYFDKELWVTLKQGGAAGTLTSPMLIIIYDDLDIALGEWKIQFGKGPKVHNGLNSVRQYLGSDNFLHVRIGIDGRQGQRAQAGSDYVLTPFLAEEKPIIDQVITKVCQDLLNRV